MIEILADRDVAESAGYIIGRFLITGLGLLLLIAGLYTRYRSRPHATAPDAADPSGYPAPPGYAVPAGSQPQPPYGASSGYAPPAVARPRRSGGMVMIVLGALIVAVSMLGALGAAGRAPKPANALPELQVGRCISSDAFRARRMHPAPTDCSRPEAVLELAWAGDGSASCPDGKRADSDYAVLLGTTRTLCFVANLREGQCYLSDPTTRGIVPLDCAGPTANVKIARRVDNSTDPGACSTDAKPVVFTVPQRVYCSIPPH